MRANEDVFPRWAAVVAGRFASSVGSSALEIMWWRSAREARRRSHGLPPGRTDWHCSSHDIQLGSSMAARRRTPAPEPAGGEDSESLRQLRRRSARPQAGDEPRSPRSQELLNALAPWSTPPPGALGGRRAACFCCALPALLSATEAPRNTLRPGVGTGYRGHGWSARQCVLSALQLNNETVSIWSHLIPAFYFVWLMVTWAADIYGTYDTVRHSLIIPSVALC